VIHPGQMVTMWVAVTVAGGSGGVVNHVAVSGGGAASAAASETTTIGAAPGFGLQRFDGGFLGGEGSPVSQAGAHPYQAVFDFSLNTLPPVRRFARIDPVGNPKQITTNLPAGLVVNPSATTVRCTEAQFESRTCPDSSAVGTVVATIGIFSLADPALSPLYNMVPPAGVPAEF